MLDCVLAVLPLALILVAPRLLAAETPYAKLAPIGSTPEILVERMLQLGSLQAGERICDLGSGDGRIVISAARTFHADATGIEIDGPLYRESNARLHELGLHKTARIIHGDLRKQRYSSYDLITVFLNREANDMIRPMLEREMKKGSRVVSEDFPFEPWRPTRIETVEDGGSGKSHTLYLYQR